MDMPIAMDRVQMAETEHYRTPARLRMVAAQGADGIAVVALFGTLLPTTPRSIPTLR